MFLPILGVRSTEKSTSGSFVGQLIKHEKGARTGRNSNVFRTERARSAEQSAGIIDEKAVDDMLACQSKTL